MLESGEYVSERSSGGGGGGGGGCADIGSETTLFKALKKSKAHLTTMEKKNSLIYYIQ